jgi:valyl-tRNA synthetase
MKKKPKSAASNGNKRPEQSLSKTFDFRTREAELYKKWEDDGHFRADASSKKPRFSMVMPPPNATGQLHLGHAARLTIEDIMARTARMRGKEVLWLPGTDHAAIATEAVVIKKLQEEGVKNPRQELGREKVLEEIKAFVKQSRSTIRGQVRRMGASCDWSRERYTMDEALGRIVNEVFTQMYDAGLIYRGKRIINWDPKLQTVVSDDEIEHKEEKAPFYYFTYGPFEIGTARPETKFGDKYVVMHPDDERYATYKHGDTFTCEWINGPVTATIIKDKAVDMNFGTGVMTITPWHDTTDFAIAARHNLEYEQIIGYDGRLLDIAGEFAGMKIAQARPKIVEKLREKGLLTRVDENYVHNVAVSYRGRGVIEPQIKEQWFIDVNKKAVDWKDTKMSLKEVMQDAVRSGDITILPKRFEKLYFHWIDNLQDWCISRQIWWGHRIPVWYHTQNGKIHVAATASALPKNANEWEQDPDTLDTWFSSALWTWSTMIDQKLALDESVSLQDLLDQSPDYRAFHPTDVLETAHEILFFWVARMILATTFVTGKIPFKTVYLGGLILTRDGKKMSKSDPAHAIDPLDVIDAMGADPLRLSMVVGSKPGQNIRIYQEKIDGFRNFTNKIWNLGKFVLMNAGDIAADDIHIELAGLDLPDRWILAKMHRTIAESSAAIDNYQFGEAAKLIIEFVRNDVADWYVEIVKQSQNAKSKQILTYVFSQSLKLLHPFMPFMTEELWLHMHPRERQLIASSWPQAYEDFLDSQSEQHMELLQEIIRGIRNIRAEYGVEPGKNVDVIIRAPESRKTLVKKYAHLIEQLAKTNSVTLKAIPATNTYPIVAIKDIEIAVMVEKQEKSISKEELAQEITRLEGFITGIEKKLKNKAFRDHAPKQVIAREEQKLHDQHQKLESLKKRAHAMDNNA